MTTAGDRTRVEVRNTEPRDFEAIIDLCLKVYPDSRPWTERQLASHLQIFPEGQFVAVETPPGRVVGMAASLIISWDDYDVSGDWRDFTDLGMFTNHDPAKGRTLYGAEVMVMPGLQRRGTGSKLYRARRELAERLGLRRIRAVGRLRWYHRHAALMSAEEYVAAVTRGEVKDPTLSFQLRQGFRVLAVIPGYLRNDPKSLGYGALIEWINPKFVAPGELPGRDLPIPQGV